MKQLEHFSAPLDSFKSRIENRAKANHSIIWAYEGPRKASPNSEKRRNGSDSELDIHSN
jgi:hypothetical protein